MTSDENVPSKHRQLEESHHPHLSFLTNYHWIEEDLPATTEHVRRVIGELKRAYEEGGRDGLRQYIAKDAIVISSSSSCTPDDPVVQNEEEESSFQFFHFEKQSPMEDGPPSNSVKTEKEIRFTNMLQELENALDSQRAESLLPPKKSLGPIPQNNDDDGEMEKSFGKIVDYHDISNTQDNAERLTDSIARQETVASLDSQVRESEETSSTEPPSVDDSICEDRKLMNVDDHNDLYQQHRGKLDHRLLKQLRGNVMKNLIIPNIIPSLLRPKHTIHRNSENNHLQAFIHPIIQVGKFFTSLDDFLGCDGRRLGVLTVQAFKCALDVVFHHKQLGEVNCTLGSQKELELTDEEWSACASFYETLFNGRWRPRAGRSLKGFRVSSDWANPSTGTPFPPYMVVALTREDQVDWARMSCIVAEYKRSECQRRKAVLEWTQDLPRLWAPAYDPNNMYVSIQTSYLTCRSSYADLSYRNYYEYYLKKWSLKVNQDCPLFRAQKLWDLPRNMNEVQDKARLSSDGCSVHNTPYGDVFDQDDILLPLEVCMEAPIADASIILHSTLLPQILYSLERQETVYALLEFCSENIKTLYSCLKSISIHLVLEALTAKSCCLDTTYDRLEYLGDAVLKLIQTDSLLNCADAGLRRWIKLLHEDDLSALRSSIGRNIWLKDACQKNGINQFILMRPLDISVWAPPLLTSYIQITDCRPSDKVQADVIEAIIGLIYLECGFASATQVSVELGIALRQQQIQENDSNGTDDNIEFIDAISRFLGVKIDNFSLLREAMTHPTVLNSIVPSYQRLEWLGDAVVCLATREWLCSQYPDKAVKVLVPIEHMIVSNEALSWLGFRSGLQRFIDHCDPSLGSRLDDYAFHLSQRNIGLWGTSSPKILADVVEALIGVVHKHSGIVLGQKSALFVLSPITSAIQTMNMSDSISQYRLMQPQHVLLQVLCPTLQIHSMADNSCIGDEIWLGSSLGWGFPWTVCDGVSVCTLSYFGKRILSTADKTSRLTAKNRACSILCAILFRLPSLLDVLKELASILQMPLKGEE